MRIKLRRKKKGVEEAVEIRQRKKKIEIPGLKKIQGGINKERE